MFAPRGLHLVKSMFVCLECAGPRLPKALTPGNITAAANEDAVSHWGCDWNAGRWKIRDSIGVLIQGNAQIELKKGGHRDT
jgi:hypothetical protein